VVDALRSREHVEWDNPYDVGMTGFIGFSSGYHAMEKCDALLMLGTDFAYRQFYPTGARVAQVDIRPEAIGPAHPSRSARQPANGCFALRTRRVAGSAEMHSGISFERGAAIISSANKALLSCHCQASSPASLGPRLAR
jgi:hypothetical protein